MKFRSKKGFMMVSVVLTVSTFLTYLLISGFNNSDKDLSLWLPSIVLILAIPLFLLWILLQTYYTLEEGNLKYVSGPIRGSIKISEITKVTKNTTLWVGLKPATARKGIIIEYDQFNEMYISPSNNDHFIQKLLEINPNIEVIDKK